MKVGIYARKSTADELDDEDRTYSRSVQDQIEDCRARAKQLDWEIVEEYPEDATSAWKKRTVTLPDGRRVGRNVRPVWQRMLDDLYHGRIEALIAYDLDRTMREPRDLEDLIEIVEQKHRKVESITGSLRLSNDAEVMAARVNVAVANKSSRDTSRRVARAALRRALDGEWHGSWTAPPGLKVAWGEKEIRGRAVKRAVAMELDEPVAALLRDAAARLLRGESLYGIVNEWNRQGHETSAGNHWTSGVLRRALLNPAMIARRTHESRPGEFFETRWPKVLDEGTWEALHTMFKAEDRPTFRPLDGSYASKRALGGGVTVCAVCGAKLFSQKHRGKPRLICHRQAGGPTACGTVTVDYAVLESFTLDMILARLDSPEFHASLVPEETDTTDPERPLRDELRRLDVRRKKVQDGYEAEIYTKAETKTRLRDIEAERAAVEGKLMQLAAERLRAVVVTNAEDALALWESADVPQRRRFLLSLISVVKVDRWPTGRASTLTRRRGESDEDLKARQETNMRAAMRLRVEIEWRV